MKNKIKELASGALFVSEDRYYVATNLQLEDKRVCVEFFIGEVKFFEMNTEVKDKFIDKFKNIKTEHATEKRIERFYYGWWESSKI